ncbi:TIGR02147 family protein [Fibrobacter sp. UWH5]|uniref:TIGR02147 family protein n=1 Tax=Fibrobacter sp. UWH5 TaxID=1896211 RepID=UPI00091CF3EC|nr:TIGR02147 family protein [Fibrobacter sp. UWH5]SHL20164.1 TIGR02147 family protein [Fibrobacter sp. UWH5]
MKKIIEYTDYRRYIADYYADRKARKSFTWRDFAKSAGFSSPVYLKLVAEGKYNLSDAAVERVAVAMGLRDWEVDYFKVLVSLNHAKDNESRREYFNEMLRIADVHKATVVEGDSFRFFSDWKNPVIRELAPAMPGAKPLAMARACISKITAAEVSETLAFLTKAGLLKKNADGSYTQTEQFVTTGPMEITPLAVRQLHRQMGELAIDTIENVAQKERHFSGLTMGLSEKSYEKVVQKIAEFRKSVADIVMADDKMERVYRLNMQLFPMSQKISGEKK